ncbi:unnamed protein product [Caenorhabditis angaria]|uniref:ZP domain-containing protein n=1 Tax=Caenorhabditis angaria TaxID=860376 RepID=A0A9P1N4W0_9PELO|nr:unnamed protein product [Caenorhabditis angaria]
MILFLIFLFAPVFSLPRIQNEMMADPEVICDVREIRIQVKTTNGFAGNLYTKGFFHNSNCRIRGNTVQNSLELILPVDGDCGIRRKRQTNPRGILLDTTIILMFHPVFLTQTDRSYHIQCQYTETDRTVTNALDVSMQPPSELPQSVQQADPEQAPVCKYEVLMGSENGPPLSHATVGDAVYHKWSCEGSNKDMYCMTVHSCIVDDGQGFGQKLVDEHGCTLDNFILREIEYKEDLKAGQLSNVFKFADKPTVFFSCMIRVELKEMASATCSPPSEAQCTISRANKNLTNDVMTEPKVTGEIPKDFPRPPNVTHSSKHSGLNNYSGIDDSSEEVEEDDEDPFPDADKPLQISPAMLIRRRDVDDRKQFDFDVFAPSVDVRDLAETDIKSGDSKKNSESSKTDVCVPRFTMFLSMFILIILTIVAIVSLYLLVVNITEKSKKIRKEMPNPLNF